MRIRPPSQPRGMTLVELLVVVVILLLLSVMTIPRLMPNDTQKGREAALTVTSVASRVLRRAEQNRAGAGGPRGAGLWLEPVDRLNVVDPDTGEPIPEAAQYARRGSREPLWGRSRGVGELFVCEPQDPYRGDDPETAMVFVKPVGGTYALLLFSTLTSPNLREFGRSASRINIAGNSYFLRVLTGDEQASWAASNIDLLPPPYSPTTFPRIDQRGFYVTKPLTGAGEAYRPFNLGEPSMRKGDIHLAFAQVIPPSVTPLTQTTPYFSPGTPPGALYTAVPPCNADGRTAPSEEGCKCINRETEKDEAGYDKLDENGQVIYVKEDGRFVCVPHDGENPSDFPAIDVGTSFSIDRPVTRSAAAPVSLPDGFGIDLAWSSYGDRLLAPLHAIRDASGRPDPGVGGFAGIDGLLSHHPVMLMFSKQGSISALLYHRREVIAGFPTVVEARLDEPADVFLLVGRLDRAGRRYNPFPSEQNPGANWQYSDSRWIRISRSTGEFLIADPVPKAVDARSSQQLARLGIATARN